MYYILINKMYYYCRVRRSKSAAETVLIDELKYPPTPLIGIKSRIACAVAWATPTSATSGVNVRQPRDKNVPLCRMQTSEIYVSQLKHEHSIGISTS